MVFVEQPFSSASFFADIWPTHRISALALPYADAALKLLVFGLNTSIHQFTTWQSFGLLRLLGALQDAYSRARDMFELLP